MSTTPIKISKKIKSLDISWIRKMFELAKTMKDSIDLSLGLPDFDVPDEIKSQAIKYIKNGQNCYTPTLGLTDLRERIVKKSREENNINCNIENVIITSAVTWGLAITFMTLLDPWDEVIIIDPYFVIYPSIIKQNWWIPVFVNAREDFSLNIEQIESSITSRTKAIIINSPNNPSWKVYSEEELRELAKILEKYDLTVISDEIYEYFVYHGHKNFSIGSIYPKTITLNGFSKSYAMSGWRIWYMVAPADFINEVIKAEQFNFVCPPTPFQYAWVDAMDVDISWYIKDYEQRSNYIYNSLIKKYDLIIPEWAFYAFIKYPYDWKKFIQNCINKNLIIVPGNVFSNQDTHFRISFATNRFNLEKAMKILNELV